MLKALDLFGVRPIWYIGGQKKNTTSNGYMFSFGLLSFSLWMLILLSHDLINRANPQVAKSTQQGVILESPIYINLSDFNYMYAVVGEDGTLVYNTSLFTVEAYVYYNNFTTETLLMKNCTVDDIDRIIPYEGTVYCMDPKQSIYYDGVNAYTEVKFKMCENSTENNFSCAPYEEIKEKMSMSLFFIFLPVYSIVPNDYENPFQMKWNYVSYTIDVDKTKVLNTLFKMAELQTDDGWLMASSSKKRQMIHDVVIFDVGTPDYYDAMIDFQMWSMGDLDIVYRRFVKFQDFLAQAFGLIQFIILGLSVVFIPYARYKMYEYIGNHIFDLSIDPRKRKKRSTRLIKFQNSLSVPQEAVDITTSRRSKPAIFQSARVSAFSVQDFDAHPNLVNYPVSQQQREVNIGNESKEYVHPEPEPEPEDYGDISYGYDIPRKDSTQTGISGATKTKSSFFDYFRNICKKKELTAKNPRMKYTLSVCEYFFSFVRNSPKKILLERVENEIIRNLDILSFCNKMVEFELLKNYLLTENQQALFSNLPRPKISLRISTEKKSFSYSDTPPHNFRIDSVLKSKFKNDDELDKIMDDMQRNDMSMIDHKLLTRFKPMLKNASQSIVEEG